MSALAQITKKYATPLWPWYITGLTALAITNYVTLMIPNFAKEIINTIQSGSEYEQIKTLSLSIIGFGFFLILIRSLSRLLLFWPGRVIEADLKKDILSHLLRTEEREFNKFDFGDLVSRGANDVGHLRALYAFAFLQIVNLLFLVAFAVAQMTAINGWLTLASLCPLTLMVIIGKFMMPLMFKYSNIQQQIVAKLTSSTTEAYSNIQSIKLQNAEDHFIDINKKNNRDLKNANIKLAAVRNFFWPLIAGLQNISVLVVLFYGGYLVIESQISIGDILAFSMYIALLSFPLTAIGFVIGIYQRTKVASKRIKAIFDSNLEMSDGASPNQSDQSKSIIKVSDLNFIYPKSERKTLAHLSFTLKQGEKLGIYGPIGSGKTTLFQLISRMIECPGNAIYFADTNINTMSCSELRRRIIYCEQESKFLSTSIRENLQLGMEFTEEQIKDAIEVAQMQDDIALFDKGLETQIGEYGYKLSGGQKQRLSLARTILRINQDNAALLLLDDIFSAVDHHTEQEIIRFLNGLKTAMILATHRPSVLRHCDQVLFLDTHGRGEVISKHHELFNHRLDEIESLQKNQGTDS